MARILASIFRVLQRVSQYLEGDGGNVGRGDVTDKGHAAAGSADVLTTDSGNEVCFSGPVHITEPGDENKLPDTGEAAAASAAQEATEEVQNTNQEQSESLRIFPERSLSTSQNRPKRRATTRVPGSETEQETKKTRRARGPNWSSEETETLKACKSQPSVPKGKQGWEAIAAKIPRRDADQCRQRWDTLQKRHKKTPTTTTSSGPAATELNGASTSTHLVGKPNLPSSASPNLEVSRPAAFSVEQKPCAVEIEEWSVYEEAGSYLVLLDRQLLGTSKDEEVSEVRECKTDATQHMGATFPFLRHGELWQKVRQQQPGLKDRFDALANSTVWLSKSLRRQSSQP